MTNRVLVAAFLLLFSAGHRRKEDAPPPPRRVLNVSGSSRLDVPFFAAFGHPMSDDRGNLYFRAATRSYNNSTLIGISRKSSQPKFLTLPDEFAQKTAFESFFVTPSGSVYVVAYTADHTRIVFEFNSDGEATRHTTLASPPDVFVDSVAVFEDGNFFVSGYHGSSAPPHLKGRPFVAIFDTSGTLIREFRNSEIPVTGNLGESSSTTAPAELWSCLGSDGNLYFLAVDQILVISESSGIVRRIKFMKPDKSAFAVKVEISDGLAAVWLVNIGSDQSSSLQLLTIDLDKGRPLALYSPSNELGDNAVSFSRTEGFVFMQNKDNKIVLLTAPLT